MNQHIKEIVIVGGGSSGWMTAAAICKQLPNIKLTLIESPNVPTIGVGESTIGHINEFFHLLGIKDEDWMAACNATYKTSIKFVDFRENPTEEPHKFHYPFGIFDTTDKRRGLMEWFIYKTINPNVSNSNFAEFFHDAVIMTDHNKMTKNEDGAIRAFDFASDTAYHMDATLFGNWLRDNICLPSGMTHILEDVATVTKNDRGEISHIITDEGRELRADLFVDCTGFKSLLLEQTMGVEFVSFSNNLHNDRAIATTIPYIDIDRELENYTSCTAIESGWVWNIPLWNRIGTGYVYSSKFATEEEAEEQFRKHLKSNRMVCPDPARADQAKFKHIKIKHGVHKRAWEKNVIGVGLANGFIEPLESTGLMLTHECIIKFIHTLQMRNGRVTQYDIDLFNYAFNEQIWGFKEFIAQHYALSMRDDTPYWREVTSNTTYCQSMNDLTFDLIGNYQDTAQRLHRSHAFTETMSGIVYIAAGMGYNPVNPTKVEWLNKRYHETNEMTIEARAMWEDHVQNKLLPHLETLPSHYEFLKQNIYN